MDIALIGYGKMGKTIERLALAKGHSINHIIDTEDSIDSITPGSVDVAIEFTQPEAAFNNISYCINNGIAVITGTTGWDNQRREAEKLCVENEGTFLFASNYSIGVNLFFELNEWLANKMNSLGFNPEITEVHHTEKKDSPSGTAITLAEGILQNDPVRNDWINEKTTDHKKLGIVSERKPNVPGTHTVTYSSKLETIDMVHTAHDRSVFAEGAIQVAEWIYTKKGVFTMSDFINRN